jgi:hypothetical protein
MELSLPTSSAAKAASTQPAAASFSAHAPSTLFPMAFMLTGLVAIFAGVGWLVLRPSLLAAYHYNQYVIAVTHLFVLGGICSIVMGAMYQLLPVALETRLHSERLAHWQLVIHIVGFAGMVWMFRVWNLKQVGHFGSVLALGVGLFVYNIVRTLRRVPKWNVTATAVAIALVWISLAVTAGLVIAIAKCANAIAFDPPAEPVSAIMRAMRPVGNFMGRFDTISAMHAHAHLGGVGFFITLVMGVSYKLIPMFTLSEVQSSRRAKWSVLLLNFGLAGSFVTILFRSPWKLAFTVIMIAGLAVYGRELAAILRARKRRAFDWGVKYFLTAVALLVPLSVLAAVLSWPALPTNLFTEQLENVYGFLGLIGVVALALIGMLYKIIPFLIWFHCYSRAIGRRRVPLLAEMYCAVLQAVGYWTFLAGLAITCVAMISANETGVRTGCSLLALSLATLAVNVGRMLMHFVRPKLEPLVTRPTIASKPA